MPNKNAAMERGALIARTSQLTQVEDARVVTYLAVKPGADDGVNTHRLVVCQEVIKSTPWSGEVILAYLGDDTATALIGTGSPIVAIDAQNNVCVFDEAPADFQLVNDPAQNHLMIRFADGREIHLTGVEKDAFAADFPEIFTHFAAA